MFLYQYINFPNYNNISNELYDLLDLKNVKDINSVSYPTELKKDSSKTLYEGLQQLNLLEHFNSIGLVIVKSNNELPIHKDTGSYIWSLNIPILNTVNTFNIFYNISEEPKLIPSRNGIASFMDYSDSKHTIIEKFILNRPALLHTKIPHNVVNNNEVPRYTLAIRLNEKFDPLSLKNYFLD